jgi:hypothetical protein
VRNESAKFHLGQGVCYGGRLWKVVSGEVLGVTGWRYDLVNESGQIIHAVYESEIGA